MYIFTPVFASPCCDRSGARRESAGAEFRTSLFGERIKDAARLGGASSPLWAMGSSRCVGAVAIVRFRRQNLIFQALPK
jgi:hypothetical protein